MSDFNMDDVTHAVRFNNVFFIVCAIALVIAPIKIVCSLYHQMQQLKDNLDEQLEGGGVDDNTAVVNDSWKGINDNEAGADDKEAGADDKEAGVDDNEAGADIT